LKLIILDRDGVINIDRQKGVRKPDEWEPLPGSLEAIAALNQAGYQIAVATNQSGIARGLLELETLFAIHRRMHESIVHAGGYVDTIVFCPHSDANECDCRKPKPGMLYKISERLGVELPSVHVVGVYWLRRVMVKRPWNPIRASTIYQPMPVLRRLWKSCCRQERSMLSLVDLNCARNYS